ncbi:DUF262 domain-containing protein [Streptomyces longhuiensis]|uniref:DUF262 domain-containing protein n=1 Tax=Streptomyces longhuiensis TaxID=2880933 RepID=UPI001D0A5AD1|nr:DUF262 domain-containing protein [Streptomyces longhuiensis]UDM01269.1 DUF262 domain-containing protein [Streptomyces longhuiensis]
MAIIKQAARQNLGQLIGANNPVVTVPDDSQRQYSWTKKEVDVYWDDIEKFKEGKDSGKESASEYFIGPVVTITAEKVSGRALLDGQQRLTTSTILLAVIRDILWQTNAPEAKLSANNIQRDYIARKSGRKDPMEYFLVLSLFDRDFFRDYIQKWSEITGECARMEAATRPSHNLIKDAYANLYAKVKARLQFFADDEDRLDYLDALRECLIYGLVFVEIQTPTSSDANEVFETINSRGKDLSTVDLVRNFLMEKSRGDDEKERVNNAWRSLLDDFDRREDIEKFLRHFWVSKHGDVKSHSLYITIRRDLTAHFDRRPQTYGVGAFSAELEKAAARYAELISQNTGNSEFDASLSEIKALSADALYPLLLSASEGAAYDDMQGLIDAAISYYVRWTVVGTRESTLLEENLFGVAKELSRGGPLSGAVKRVVGWIPDDEAFFTGFREASIPKQAQSRYLLAKIEKSLRDDAGIHEEVVLGSGKVHVENIYPLNPEAGYRLEDHDAWVNRLGNLTLLTGRRNATVSSRPFPEKDHVYGASALLVSSRTQVDSLWDGGTSKWRTDGIVERQERLARIALNVWPSKLGE